MSQLGTNNKTSWLCLGTKTSQLDYAIKLFGEVWRIICLRLGNKTICFASGTNASCLDLGTKTTQLGLGIKMSWLGLCTNTNCLGLSSSTSCSGLGTNFFGYVCRPGNANWLIQ